MIDLLNLLPLKISSRWVGRFTKIRWPWLKNALIRLFIRHYDIDLSELARPNIAQYENLNDFFTRELKPNSRSHLPQTTKIISPVDGYISALGKIQAGKLLQAKQIYYDITTLLGHNLEDARQFESGEFITLYLAPHNYHRVHMPIDATLEKMIYVPGHLFTLNPLAVRWVPQLFSRNERVVCLFSTANGPMAIILVGALFVGSIITTWHGPVNASHSTHPRIWDYTNQTIHLIQHQELGRFQYGSTVILLFPQDSIAWENLQLNQTVQVGQPLADVIAY